MNGIFRWLQEERIARYLLLIPLVLLLLGLLGFPGLYDIYFSLHKVSLNNLDNPEFIGISNYINVLSDSEFWQSLGFSLKFSLLVVIVEVILGVALALFFNSYLKNQRWLLSFILLPMMTAPALMGIMFRLLLNDFVGMVPQYLNMLGFWGISLLSQDYVVPTIIVIDMIQWTPFVFIIAYASLQTIPGELLEASLVDGCNGWQRLIKVILPIMTPILVTIGFFRFIDSFRIFDKIYVLTGGGPGNLTTSITIYIYKMAFSYGSIGESIAASLILLLLSLIPLLFSIKYVLRGEAL